MKNLIQSGNAIALTAPQAVTSGDGLLIGSILGATTEAGAGDAIGRMRPNAASDRRYTWNA